MNITRKENFSQVCVWPGCLVEGKVEEFEKFMLDEFKTRIQYLEEIKTFPDTENGFPVKDTGGRNDVVFAVHQEDIGHFAVPRLQMGIRWIEDVLAPGNYSSEIYPKRVFEYKTW